MGVGHARALVGARVCAIGACADVRSVAERLCGRVAVAIVQFGAARVVEAAPCQGVRPRYCARLDTRLLARPSVIGGTLNGDVETSNS